LAASKAASAPSFNSPAKSLLAPLNGAIRPKRIVFSSAFAAAAAAAAAARPP